jgi:hypothetical protein
LPFTFQVTSTEYDFIIAGIRYVTRHSSNGITTARKHRNYWLSTETWLSASIVAGLEIQREKCIPVGFVITRACEIWWIICLIYFITPVVIKKTSASWQRALWANWHRMLHSVSTNNKAGEIRLTTYAWPAHHTSGLWNMTPVFGDMRH